MRTEGREISKNFKLVREIGGSRIVHARGCESIRNYCVDGMEEISEYRPGKMRPCAHCERYVFVANAAKDYVEHIREYHEIFDKLSICSVRRLFKKSRRHMDLEIIGQRLYMRVDRERWYIDISLLAIGEVRVFHNNYNITKRDNDDAAWTEVGYHEHQLKGRYETQIEEAIMQAASYDYEKAKEAHKAKQKNNRRVTFSELDAEYWGFSDGLMGYQKMR